MHTDKPNFSSTFFCGKGSACNTLTCQHGVLGIHFAFLCTRISIHGLQFSLDSTKPYKNALLDGVAFSQLDLLLWGCIFIRVTRIGVIHFQNFGGKQKVTKLELQKLFCSKSD